MQYFEKQSCFSFFSGLRSGNKAQGCLTETADVRDNPMVEQIRGGTESVAGCARHSVQGAKAVTAFL